MNHYKIKSLALCKTISSQTLSTKMTAQNNLSLLESLPQDLLGEILSRVASSSREDIGNCLLVSKTISSAVEDERVFNKLNLRPQTMNPQTTFVQYNSLMDKCIRSDNPAAHYIEGVKQYFVYDNTVLGMYHLRKSAEGSYGNGTYLYAILLLCTGNQEEGTMVLRSLGWEASRRRGDRCWRENKISLRTFIITVKPEYIQNMMTNAPPLTCHWNDLDTRCARCYIFKQMQKFIIFIQ